jgi:hypothetical protein
MRLLLATIFTLFFKFSFGQTFSYPIIKTTASQVSDFIPSGWALLDTAMGDLNKDGIADIALVIQFRDSARITLIGYNDVDTVFAQPRMLLIAFYNNNGKEFHLVEQSNTFILSHDDPNMEEPFQDISITKGILQIDFNIFMNSGGWGTFINSYKFRYESNEFKLIGADYHYINRGSGETEDRSYNFLTRRVKISKGTISSDKSKTKMQTISTTELKTFKTYIQPFSWKIEKDFYL